MIRVEVSRIAGAYGPKWLVTATDGSREWSDMYFGRDEAENVAANIEHGIFDPWEEAE